MIIIPSSILLIENDSDRAFMEKLYINYYKLMYTVALSRVKNSEDAQDVIHDAIIRLIDKIPLLRQKDSCVLRSYIVSTIIRTSINFNIKSTRKKAVVVEKEVLESFKDEKISLEDVVLVAFTNEELVNGLKRLPQRERDLLRWKYFDDLSDEEIAYAMGIGKNSVRQYLTRARRCLLSILEDKNDGKSRKL